MNPESDVFASRALGRSTNVKLDFEEYAYENKELNEWRRLA